MRGDEHRGAAHTCPAYFFECRFDAERVDAVERFVEQEDGGLVERGQQHRQASAHAVAEPRGHAISGAGEIESLEEVLGPLLPPGGEVAQPRGELKVLPRGGSRDESADVGAVADDLACAPRLTHRVDTRDEHGARLGREYAAEDAQGRRLAGAVAPDEGDAAAGRHSKVEVVHGEDGAEQHGKTRDLDGQAASPRGCAHTPIVSRTRPRRTTTSGTNRAGRVTPVRSRAVRGGRRARPARRFAGVSSRG